MYRKIIAGLISLSVLAGMVAIWGSVVGEANAAIAQQASATPPPNKQERQGDPSAPDISFIDSPTAQCYMPVAHKDTCYIQWGYLQVSASTSQYIISMTVAIDGRMRSYHSGFFQTLPGDRTDQVDFGCGLVSITAAIAAHGCLGAGVFRWFGATRNGARASALVSARSLVVFVSQSMATH